MLFTKWETMPEPMGIFHIIGVIMAIIFAVIGIILGKKFQNKSEDDICKIIFVVGIVMIIIEILELILKYVNRGYFDYTEIPFHICHIAMYAYVLIGVLKKGIFRNLLLNFCGIILFGVSLFYFVKPAGALGDEYIITSFYSFIYHSTLLAISLIIMISLKQYEKPAFCKFLQGYTFLIILIPIAIFINELVFWTMPQFANINLFSISAHLPVYYPILNLIVNTNTTPFPLYVLSHIIYYFVLGTLIYLFIRLIYIIIGWVKNRRASNE